MAKLFNSRQKASPSYAYVNHGKPEKVEQMIFIERIPGPFASLYEKAARMMIGAYYDNLAAEIVSHLKAGAILDLGTGPGYLPMEIVKRAPSIEVDGIDLSRKLIRMAKLNASKSGAAERLNFEVGDAAKLRFEDCSYDMVISTGMLHMLRYPTKVLKECYRVLKPGGEAWIYDPARIASQINMKKWKASLTFKERLMYKLFSLFRVINPPRFYNREQVISMIGAANFREYWIEEENKEMIIKLTK